MNYDYKYLQCLQKIKIETNPAEKKRLIAALAEAKGNGKSTVRRHLKDGVPGHNNKIHGNKNNVKVPVTKKMLEVAAEVKKSGGDLTDIKHEILEKTGADLSSRKINEVSSMIKHYDDDKITEFGDPFEDFIQAHFKLDKIPADQNVPITLGPFSWLMPKEDVLDIVMLLKNSWNRAQMDATNHFPLDREAMREMLLLHIHESMIRKLRDSGEVKDLKELNIINKGFRMKLDLTEDLKAIERSFQEIKPGITLVEIAALIRKHHHGASK